YFLVAWNYGAQRPLAELVTLDEATGLITRHDTWSTPDAGYYDEAVRLAPVTPGNTVLTYAQHDPVAGVDRIRVRGITTLRPGQMCSSPGQCGSGSCNSGLCCGVRADGGCLAVSA